MGRKRKRLGDDVTSVTSSVGSRTADGRAQPASSPPDGDSAQDDGPAPRNAANERERARMRVLSRAFTRLKTSLPWVPADTKLSKLDTLRLASCYIAHLSRLLAEDDDIKSGAVSSGTGTGTGTAGAGTDDVHSSTSHAAAVATSSTPNIHPISLTWPFSFSSRTGGGAAMPQSFQLPRSAPCDVVRTGGVASPGHVTSTAKVKVKVKVGADSSSSQPQPSALSTTC